MELEPGIIDAYEGEDRLEDVLGEMRERGFWVSEMTVRGSTRVDSDLIRAAIGARASGYLDACHKTAPGWVELEYFNGFFEDDVLGKREFLLGYLFASLRGHYAFALELATRGRERFGSPFEELESTASRHVRSRFARLPVGIAAALGRRAVRR